MLRRILILGLLLFTVWNHLALAQEVPPITYERYDVLIDIQEDGTFQVQEVQQIRFDDRFEGAFAEIPLDYTTRIDDVRVLEGDVPYERNQSGPGSYTVDYEGDSLFVDWTFAPTRAGELRTFVLEYTVVGGLWVYPDGDILEWRVVPADRSGIPVLASRAVVTFPTPVPASDLQATAFGPPFETQIAAGQVILESSSALQDGQAFQAQVGFPHGLVAAQPQAWQIAEDTADLRYQVEAWDVSLRIDADGQVQVEESQRVAVEAGTLYGGSREISLRGMDGITDLGVFEGDQPLAEQAEPCASCYQVSIQPRQPGWAFIDSYSNTLVVDENQAGRADVNWTVPPLVAGEETTFRVDYTALGALRILDEGQLLNWTVVPADRWVPTNLASLQLELPPGISPDEIAVQGGAARVQADGRLLVAPDEAVAPGEPWQVSLTLPPGATNATTPQWQQELEALAADAAQAQLRRSRLQLLAGSLGLLILVGGLLGLLLAWYRWGRDVPVGLAASYLAEPPSDLPPGIVSYLLEEKPTTHGALGSLFQLATLGLLTIKLQPKITVQRNWEEKLAEGQIVETLDGRATAVPGHSTTLYNALAPRLPRDKSVPLEQIYRSFQKALPQVYDEMTKEVAGYFEGQPQKTRKRWNLLGASLLVLGLGGLVFGCVLSAQIGLVALTPALALLVVGLVAVLVSRWMPQRTPAGAEEAEKWRAFRRYLLDLEDYGDEADAQAILDRYFAYAVALDVEEVVILQAESMQALMPIWSYGMLVEPATPHDGRLRVRPQQDPSAAQATTGSPQPASSSPTVDAGQRPAADRSLSGLSRQIGRNLNEASLGLSRVLRTAAGAPPTVSYRVQGVDRTVSGSATTLEVIGQILRASSSAGGGSSYRGSSSSWRSSSRSSSFSRSRSSSRSSSSRRSGGGGRRGFR